MKVCFIGGGNMASAMIGGLLKSGVPAGAVTVVDVDASQRERLVARFGVRTFEAAAPAVAGVHLAFVPGWDEARPVAGITATARAAAPMSLINPCGGDARRRREQAGRRPSGRTSTARGRPER
jgi:3-hydroxyisobutyrate dehydrogenase-like beta-hydroxyacid dehydrogenase